MIFQTQLHFTVRSCINGGMTMRSPCPCGSCPSLEAKPVESILLLTLMKKCLAKAPVRTVRQQIAPSLFHYKSAAGTNFPRRSLHSKKFRVTQRSIVAAYVYAHNSCAHWVLTHSFDRLFTGAQHQDELAECCPFAGASAPSAIP